MDGRVAPWASSISRIVVWVWLVCMILSRGFPDSSRVELRFSVCPRIICATTLPYLVQLLYLLQGTLVDLDLSGNHILVGGPINNVDSLANAMAKALAKCNLLLHLSLMDCCLSGSIIQCLLESCPQPIQSLNLANNPIGPRVGARLIQDALPHRFTHLRVLNVSGTLPDTRRANICILDFFWRNTTLHQVTLPRDAVGIEALVQSYVRRNRELEYVKHFFSSSCSSENAASSLGHTKTNSKDLLLDVALKVLCPRLAAQDDPSPLYHLLIKYVAAHGTWSRTASAAYNHHPLPRTATSCSIEGFLNDGSVPAAMTTLKEQA